MSPHVPAKSRQPVRIDRSYVATVEELWALWTTKDGFESWWGPEGFRVEVHELDPREGGALFYDMIADAPEQVAFMKKEGMPLSHETRGTFVDVQAPTRLTLRHTIDFVPGQPTYLNHIQLELIPQGDKVRMLVSIEPHLDDAWTKRAAAGFTSQLNKLPGALVARRR
jgi:uncharacterized protein YndB with AHSA1/START domain